MDARLRDGTVHLGLVSGPGRPARSLSDHERLRAAYADRDTALAVAITRSIVEGGYRTIERSWTESYGE